MNILKFKDFMKKYKLKDELKTNLNYVKFIIIPYTLEILK